MIAGLKNYIHDYVGSCYMLLTCLPFCAREACTPACALKGVATYIKLDQVMLMQLAAQFSVLVAHYNFTLINVLNFDNDFKH